MKTIARIRTDFPTKFGLPRQSGLVSGLCGTVVFEPEYRDAEALRGIEGFSHLWLIWEFSEAKRDTWSPTVRPPRLGGNTRMGVFATRSPFRPNPIAMSCVELLGIELDTPDGPVIHVSGIDMMDNTPIYDIKPYIPYADCRPGARGGFTDEVAPRGVEVTFPSELLEILPEDKRDAAIGMLAQDPRPAYGSDPKRRYGVSFAGFDIGFKVADGVLTVVDVSEI